MALTAAKSTSTAAAAEQLLVAVDCLRQVVWLLAAWMQDLSLNWDFCRHQRRQQRRRH